MSTVVTVRVDLAAIQNLFEPDGGVGRYGQRVNRVAANRARTIAPKRTGRLAKSIFASPAVGRFSYAVTIGSHLPEANWVNYGTRTPILPHGRWLAVGKRERAERITYRPFVRGQRGQHFLESGMEQAFAGTGIIVAIPR